MFRLLALLQLTRAALAFTAIADAWTVLLLRLPSAPPAHPMQWMVVRMIMVSIISGCLYGFGMSLNDLLDARRDRLFAPRRPIPSGRIAPRTAIMVALLLLMVALLSAAMFSAVGVLQTIVTGEGNHQWVPWPFLTFSTAMLIVFYDAILKYWGAIGILTLGAIRSLHCLVGYPDTPLLFLSMLLLTHIFIVTLVAYKLENKRPRLTRWNVAWGIIGCCLGNALAIAYMFWRGTFSYDFGMMLIGPALAVLAFIIWSIWLMRRSDITARQKGDRLMLMGLFWLFVYDASILVSNGQYLAGLAVIALFACAIISFFSLRMLGRMIAQPKVHYRLERPAK